MLYFTFSGSDELNLFAEKFRRRISQPDAVPAVAALLEEAKCSSIYPPIRNEDQGESSPSLATSETKFVQLPDFVKSCFGCICYVTDGSSREKHDLVRLLVAQGLIEEKPGFTMEDTATNIIQDLLGLRMLEQHFYDQSIGVPRVYEKLCLQHMERVNHGAEAAKYSPFIVSVQHNNGKDIPPNLDGLPVSSLFVSTTDYNCPLSAVYLKAICRLKFDLLVLDLDGELECLPDEVGDLVHLRFLRLFFSRINKLPPTIGNLQSLQTLDLRPCDLEQLPDDVLNIQQLRHLLMFSTYGYNCEVRVGKAIGSMTKLQTLDGVYAGGGIANELSKLTQLRHLGVKRVSDDHACDLAAAIMQMSNLMSLSLEAEMTSIGRTESYIGRTESSIFPELELYSPPPLLQDLRLDGQLIEIPSWIFSIENLTSLSLSNSDLADQICIIQLLPKLKHLLLEQASKAKIIGKEFCEPGGFPLLETLTIDSRYLVEWKEIVSGAFPRLRSIAVINCPNLMVLPDGLQYITTLEELHADTYKDLKRRLEGVENYKINNIPNVWLRAR